MIIAEEKMRTMYIIMYKDNQKKTYKVLQQKGNC